MWTLWTIYEPYLLYHYQATKRCDISSDHKSTKKLSSGPIIQYFRVKNAIFQCFATKEGKLFTTHTVPRTRLLSKMEKKKHCHKSQICGPKYQKHHPNHNHNPRSLKLWGWDSRTVSIHIKQCQSTFRKYTLWALVATPAHSALDALNWGCNSRRQKHTYQYFPTQLWLADVFINERGLVPPFH